MEKHNEAQSDPYKDYRSTEILDRVSGDNKTIDADNVRDTIAELAQMDQGSLMSALIGEVSKKMANGETDDMLNTVAKIRPFLNADQGAKLDNILKTIGLGK